MSYDTEKGINGLVKAVSIPLEQGNVLRRKTK